MRPLASLNSGPIVRAEIGFGERRARQEVARFKTPFAKIPSPSCRTGLQSPGVARLPRNSLKLCGRHCYLRYSVEVAKPIEKAQVRLTEMRAPGLDPGHGGEAGPETGC